MGLEENHKNSVFHAFLGGFQSANLVLAVGACPKTPWGHYPSTLLGALPPRPPVTLVIIRGKYDQLMRPRAILGIQYLCTIGGENNRASLSRGVIRFEALGVGVGREAILVDA